MPTAPPVNQNSSSITLSDILSTAKNLKYHLIGIVIFCTLLGAAFGVLQVQVYETEAQLLPPTPAELVAYNSIIRLTGEASDELLARKREQKTYREEDLTPEVAYKVFLRHLNSIQLKQKFFEEYYQPSFPNHSSPKEKETAWNQLNKNLVIRLPNEIESTLSKVQLRGTQEPEILAKWVNTYVQLAEDSARTQLESTLKARVNLQREIISQQIKALRTAAEEEKENYITRLKDALQVAHAIGLSTPPTSGNLITSYADENLYLRGTNALASELKVTQARKNNDPYIKDLEELLKLQHLIDQVSIKADQIMPATIDKMAPIPVQPRNLPWYILLVLGFTVGIILSIITIAVTSSFKEGVVPHSE